MTDSHYDPDYFKAQLSKSDARVAFQYRQLLEYVACRDKRARVLDAGCGAAPGLRYLQNEGWLPFGIDLVLYPLLEARRLVPDARLACASLADPLPLADESFDFVLMSEVIEHLPEPLATLREICRVLRPGGSVVLTTPNLWDIRRVYFPFLRRVWSGDADPTHQHLFNPYTLRALLVDSGLTHIRVRTGIKPWLYLSSRRLKMQISFPFPPLVGNGVLAAGYKHGKPQ